MVEMLDDVVEFKKSANLDGILHLHNQWFEVEEWNGEHWEDSDFLFFAKNTVYFGGEKLHHVYYDEASHAIAYSYGKDERHRAGRLQFADDCTAFVGSRLKADGVIADVRSKKRTTVYTTERKPAVAGRYTKWDNFKIETWWEGSGRNSILKAAYYVGSTQCNPDVAVISVNKQKAETTYAGSYGGGGLFGGGQKNHFKITINGYNQKFSGTIKESDGTKYDWKGAEKAPAHAAEMAMELAHVDAETEVADQVVPTPQFSIALRADVANGPSMSLQDLDNVTSIQKLVDGHGNPIKDKNGEQKTRDDAQVWSGKYLNQCLVNALPDDWTTKIYGKKYDLPKGVQVIFKDYKDKIFSQYSVVGTGEMIYTNFRNDNTNPTRKKAADNIDKKKLDDAWKKIYKNQYFEPTTTKLYIEAYKRHVPGIQPYLNSGPEKWAKDYLNFLKSDGNIQRFQTQIISGKFKNIKHRIYEWYVKLETLAPNKGYGKKIVSVAYSAFFNAYYTQMRWTADMKPYIEEVIKNALGNGANVDKKWRDKVNKDYVEKLKVLSEAMGGATNLGTQISNLMTIWAGHKQNKATSAILAVNDANALQEPLLAQVEREVNANPTRWQQIKKSIGNTFSSIKEWYNKNSVVIKNVLGLVVYGGVAAFSLWQLIESCKSGKKMTPGQIINSIGLGILSFAMSIKVFSSVMALGVGEWLETKAAGNTGALADVAKAVATWFKKDGSFALEGRLGGVVTALFGKNVGEFFARRLGPALAIFGIVASAYSLAEAIKSGNVPSIIFDSFNTFFAVADTVFIGLEMASFSWAGPVGIAVAVVGVIVALIQFIYNIIHPPKPPAGPITQFINGPMKTAKLLKAA